jgi:carboxypeptidase family protein/TonB-dependent receptor-like protein
MKRVRTTLKIVSLSFVLFLVPMLALGQTETGQITGTISDATGAIVVGAKVAAKSVSTDATRETTTNGSGNYTISGLKPDTYEVTVEATGFKKLVRRVQVAVGSNNDLSAQLEIGSAAETVEVSGTSEAVTVNTENQTLSEVITSEQLNSLPTDPTRNPYALVATAGNVTEDCNSTRGAATTGGCGYAINGLRSASTGILLDGAENVNTFSASVGQQIPLDSVAEFSVLTNNFTSEYGRASGGVVNLVTKSGSNTFHGSAYEFNRVSALSANTFQNNATTPITPKGGFTRNNFGFALGGPVIKNKLFFFNNTEWIRVRSSSPQQLTILDPTSIPLLAPASQAYFAAYGKLVPGVATLNSGPCAKGSALTCDQVAFNVPNDAGGGNPENTWMEVAKVDYNITDKTTFSARYASYKELDFPGVVNFSPYAGYNTGQTNYDQNYLFSLTHVFTPNFVNTAKAVYNRINGPVQALGSAPVGPTLYVAGSLQNVLGTPLVFPGYNETTPGASIPFGGPQNLYQFYDDASWTLGRHQFKFGGSFVHIRDNRVFGAYLNAVEQLGTNLASGLTNLQNGTIFSWQDAIYPQGKFPCLHDPTTGATIATPSCTVTLPVTPPAFERNYHYNDGAAYVQDSWKIVPRFTLNLGVRWEYYGVQHNANPALDSNFVFGSGATEFDQIRNGTVQLAQNGGVFGKPQYTNFGPRIGFAWDPFGGGKTSVRGGFGIGYERNFGNVTFNAIQNPPNYAVISLINSSASGAKGKGDVPFLPVFTDNFGPLGGSGSKALPLVSQRAINQNLKTAYAETWDLAVERQITRHSVFSIDYAGSHGVHLYDISNINPSGAGTTYLGDPTVGNRLNFGYSNMNFRSGNAYSHYHGVTAQYKTNNLWNKGVSLNANYTWSHSLDNLSSTFTDSALGTSSGAYYLGYLDGFNPKLNYGNSDFDIRHRFVASGSWEIPWMKGSSNAFARSVLGGWGLGSVFKWRSGAPFSLFDCTNPGGTNCAEWVPSSQVAKTGYAVDAGTTNTFNYIPLPNSPALIDPKANPAGVINVGDAQGIPICSGLFHTGCRYSALGLPYPERNNYFGPGYWNVDMNFFKSFKVTERFGLQFRAEMYNIFNHHNQYINQSNLDVSSMATPFVQTEKGGPQGTAGNSTDERRNIQLGLKLTF